MTLDEAINQLKGITGSTPVNSIPDYQEAVEYLLQFVNIVRANCKHIAVDVTTMKCLLCEQTLTAEQVQGYFRA